MTYTGKENLHNVVTYALAKNKNLRQNWKCLTHF